MKTLKKLLKGAILLMLALMFNQAKAQYEWAPIGAEWYYSINGEGEYSYEKYISEKDTLIEGKLCRIVKSDFNIDYFYQDGYKVYYWLDNKFNLIYDFAAKVHDTIAFDFKLGKGCNGISGKTLAIKCIVKKIDTLIIDGNIIRAFETDFIPVEDYDIVWSAHWYVEKFGNVFAFFEALYGPRPMGCSGGTNLRCYTDNDISYTDTEYDYHSYPCDSVLNIDDRSQNNFTIIYPNPCDDFINVELLDENSYGNIEISIIDFLGREIQTLQVNCANEQIDMSALKPGAYYIKITDIKQNKSQIIRTIKQ